MAVSIRRESKTSETSFEELIEGIGKDYQALEEENKTLKQENVSLKNQLQSGDTPSAAKTGQGSKKAQRISNPLNKRLYDLKEAAVYLGRPVYSVRCLIWTGILPVVRTGKKQYLDIADMDTFIERNKETII